MSIASLFKQGLTHRCSASLSCLAFSALRLKKKDLNHYIIKTQPIDTIDVYGIYYI